MAHVRYRAGLDGLRAVAILAVLLHHLAAFLVPSTFDWLLPGGFLGVDIFFVLSGFLITSIVASHLESQRPWLLGFYRRRGRRLLPALVALLVGVTVLSAAVGRPGDLAGTWAASLAFLFNWAWLGPLEPNDLSHHLWSIAVEGQFYVVWPPVLVLARRRVVPLLVVLLAVLLVWRSDLFTDDWSRVYFRTDARLDALLVGCLVAAAPGLRSALARYAPLGAVLLGAALLTAHRDDPWLYDGGFTLVALAAATLVASVVEDGRGSTALAHPVLVRIGVLSYSLYLWHYPLFRLVAELPGAVVIGPTLTALAAVASHHLVERPFLRHRDVGDDRPLASEADERVRGDHGDVRSGTIASR
jgi:peptidoglycan/LPS O-acetylase OafA/YrhL